MLQVILTEIKSMRAGINDFKVVTGNQLQNLSTKLSGLRSEVSELHHQLNELREEVSDLRGQFNELRDEVGDLRGQVNVLRDDVTDLRGQFNALELRTMRLEETVNRIETKVDATFEQVGGLLEFRTETAAAIENLKKDQRAYQEIIGRHELN